jgi:hypothetical protein
MKNLVKGKPIPARCRGSHIFQTTGSQITVRLSALVPLSTTKFRRPVDKPGGLVHEDGRRMENVYLLASTYLLYKNEHYNLKKLSVKQVKRTMNYFCLP